MKFRRIPAGEKDDLRAGAMALGLISARIPFDYEYHNGEHRIWAHVPLEGKIPDSCEPETWMDV